MKKLKHPVKIDKGIPVPAKSKYPVLELEIGDSFAVNLPAGADERKKLRNQVQSMLTHYKSRFDVHFTTRTVFEGGRRVLRVWRVEKKAY